MTPERVEEELFGIEDSNGLVRPGLLEQGHGGTLYLDEIADMPLTTQGKILRVLTDQSFTRVGGQRLVNVDVRVISSTARQLSVEIEQRRFREDLFYRLNVVPVSLPPLSERRDDIPPLVEHYLTRSIADQARTIRIPVHMIETINKLNRISRQMLQQFGREATPEELAKEMDMPEDKIRKFMKIAKEPISMETPIGDDEDSHLGDFIEDTNVESPIDSTTNTNLMETVRDVLAGLTPREAKVLRMRFGIDMNTDHTLEEVGKQFDVTRERIRQIEAKALRKLRHPSRSEEKRKK